MPVRIFDATDVINIVSDWGVGDPNGVENQNGAAYITDFGNWEIRGSGAFSGGTVAVPAGSSIFGTYYSTGTIDWARPPLIPASASITNIRYRLGCSLEGTANAAGISGSLTAQSNVGPLVGLAGIYPANIGLFTANASPVVQPSFVYVNPDSHSDAFNPVSSSGSNSQAATYFDIPITYPISYGDLISQYSDLYFQISINVWASGASGATDFTCSFSDFSLEVTYEAGTTPFNWYLKTHNLDDGSIIVDDIVTEVPPDDDGFTYILFGTSETYPTEESIPEEVWTRDPVIVVQPITPGPGWTKLTKLITGDDTASGGVKVSGTPVGPGGDSGGAIKIFVPSIPQVQSGKAWSLQRFMFRYRIEENS